MESGGKRSAWAPKIWLGCDLFAWLRIVAEGRCSFGLRELRLLPIGTAIATGHTILRYVQHARHGRAIRETRLRHPPLFIIGHWRSGTTYLHELLVRDPRHTCPDTYQCFDPCHPLLTAKLARQFLTWMLPKNRIMDNMPVGWDRPQEDEFALAMLGAPSPYADIAFPNRRPMEPASLDLDGLPKHRHDQWKRTFRRFVQMLAFRDPRRLVLKSPPHTCRIPTLLEVFPDARFIHIVRDPVAVFASTVNLWKKLMGTQSLHRPNFDGLEEQVFETFLHFHRRLQATRGLVPAENFHEIKYEALTKDPVGELRAIYERLQLGDFPSYRPHLDAYLAETANYEKNKWQISDEERGRIAARWGEVMRHYGYDRSADPAAA